jgi:hypothetical protein
MHHPSLLFGRVERKTMAAVRLRDLTAFSTPVDPIALANSKPTPTGGIVPVHDTGDALEAIKERPQPHFDADTQRHNVDLKSVVLELEDLIDTTGEVQVEGIRSSEALLAARVKNSRDALERFDREYRHPTSSKFSREKYIEQLDLRVSTAALQRAMKILQRVERLQATGEAIVDDEPRAESSRTPSRAASMAATLVPNVQFGPSTAAAAQRGETLCAELARELSPEESQARGADLGKVLDSFFPPHGGAMGRHLFTINAIAHMDVMRSVRAALDASEAEALQAIAAAEEAEARFREALASATDDAGVQRASDLLLECVRAQEAALRVAKLRIGQLLMNRSEDDGNVRATFERARDDTLAWLEEQRAAKQMLLHDARHDLAATDETYLTRIAEDQRASEAHRAETDSSFAAMDDLGHKQAALWREVEEKVAAIGQLSKQRFDIVRSHLKRSEVEWHRKRFHDEYVAVHVRHTQNLQSTEALSVLSTQLIDTLADALEKLSTQVEAKDMHEGLDDSKRHELQRFTEIYPRYAVMANRLLARVDGRALMSARAARLAAANAKLAEQAVDPDRPKYLAMHRELSDAAAGFDTQSRALAGTIEYWDGVAEGFAEECTKIGLIFDVTHQTEIAEWAAIIKAARDEEADLVRREATEVELAEAQEGQRVAATTAATEQRHSRIESRRAAKLSASRERVAAPPPTQ